MEVIAKGKYIRISPKKARPIASLIRGKNARQAQVMLSGMPQKSAAVIRKVLDSAMANAENDFNLDKNELTISKITVDGGPVLKRFMPRAQGRASEIRKRTSHIEIIVSGEVKTKKKDDKKENSIKVAPKTVKDESHKIEVERTEKISLQDNRNKGKQIFRRKTG